MLVTFLFKFVNFIISVYYIFQQGINGINHFSQMKQFILQTQFNVSIFKLVEKYPTIPEILDYAILPFSFEKREGFNIDKHCCKIAMDSLIKIPF
jgi:hypothetical protein